MNSISEAAAKHTAIASMAFLLGGCGTANTVILKPLETKYPVSASKQYVDVTGNIVREDDYEVIQSFEIEKTIEGPLGDDTETPLDLTQDLDGYVARYKGDAVTRVKIVGSDYDLGTIGTNTTLKFMGWTISLTGAAFMLTGALVPDDRPPNEMLISGAALFGVGLATYLLSYAYNDPTSWKVHVSGDVVRLNTVPRAPAQEFGPVPASSSTLPQLIPPRGIVLGQSDGGKALLAPWALQLPSPHRRSVSASLPISTSSAEPLLSP